MPKLGILIVMLAAAGDARGEGAGSAPKGAVSDANRLYAATSLARLGGGFVSVGGSALRYLAPGAKRWVTLEQKPGDNLYRIARGGAAKDVSS